MMSTHGWGALEEAYEEERLTPNEGKRLFECYEQGIRSYTYID